MKEIGGYFEIECFGNGLYHDNSILLNSGRNALRYIIRAFKIDELLVPKYTCDVVYDSIQLENCKIIPYSIDENFFPKINFQKNNLIKPYILFNNYFGVTGNVVDKLASQYDNLIVDAAQSFYTPKKGIATFYSPRKFFGLPDGGILISDKILEDKFEQDISYEKCSHLIKRHDLNASFGYNDFRNNDNSLINKSIKFQSKLTTKLMGNINYNESKKRRLENFYFLHEELNSKNEIKIFPAIDDVPMVYPFLIKNEKLRQRLIDKKIYVASYWPNIDKYCENDSYEMYLQKYLIPLPIDQRYCIDDMKFILESIEN